MFATETGSFVVKVLLVEIWAHGGTARYATELGAALSRLAGDSAGISLLVPANFSYDTAEKVCTRAGLPVLTGGTSDIRALRALRYVAQWIRQQVAIASAIRRMRPTVVHFLGTSVASAPIYRICADLKIRTLVTVHDLPVRNPGTGVGLRATSFAFTRADRILVHGEWTREAIAQQFGDLAKAKTAVVPFGIFTPGAPVEARKGFRDRYGIPEAARVALFFGSIRRNKGLDLLMRAFDLSEDQSLWLLVAGRPAGRSEPPAVFYSDLLSQRSRDRVVWIDEFVPEEEIKEIFDAADVLVLPYRSSFASQSAVLGLAVAAGLPVIASNVGEIGPLVRRYGLGECVEPESVEALSSKLASFARRTGFDSNMGFTRARTDMSWPSVARAIWSEYFRSIEQEAVPVASGQ